MGNPVRSSEGREIGTVRQLLINPEDGKVAYVVVARGGILGFSGDLIAVPWDDVKVGRDMDKVIIIVDKEILEKAPRVAEGKDSDIHRREAYPAQRSTSGKLYHGTR